jgi:hypothetical protein
MIVEAYIYALIDPDTNEIRYVGRTKDLSKRYSRHLIESQLPQSKTHKHNWIRKILKNGKKPLIRVLEKVPYEHCIETEQKWIASLKSGGLLTNSSDGGDGLINPSSETRNRMSTAQKKYWESLSTTARAEKINILTRQYRTPEGRLSARLRRLGRRTPEETKIKISQKNKGKKISTETKIKISIAKKHTMSLIPFEQQSKKLTAIRKGHKNKNARSKYLGVAYSNRKKPWFSYIDGKYIGRYKTEIEAAKAYNIKALELHGPSFPFFNNIADFNPENEKNLIKRNPAWGKSNYRGVSITKTGKYQAQIYRHGYIGTYKNEIDAAKAYDAMAIQIFGPSAKLNLPPSPIN